MPDDEPNRTSDDSNFQKIWRNLIILIVIGSGAFIGAISIIYFMQDAIILDLGYRHFASIFGLPAAAAAALLVVMVTRAVSGPMSVEFFGLKFQGAASETVMWVVCFLAISYAVEATWKLEYSPPSGVMGTVH